MRVLYGALDIEDLSVGALYVKNLLLRGVPKT